MTTLGRDRKHDHFWTDSGELYESYRTIRGLRWRHRMPVPGMPDTDKLTDEQIAHVESAYLLHTLP